MISQVYRVSLVRYRKHVKMQFSGLTIVLRKNMQAIQENVCHVLLENTQSLLGKVFASLVPKVTSVLME